MQISEKNSKKIKDIVEQNNKLEAKCMSLDQKCRELEQKIKESHEKIRELNDNISATQETTKQNEDDIDDIRNRSMRSTLVFQNIDGTDKTWQETTNLLVTTLHEVLGDACEVIDDHLDRVHRAKNKPTHKPNAPKAIIAKFTNWRFADYVKHTLIRAKIAGNTDITVSQLYSKKVNERRSKAFSHRTALKEKDPNMMYYVEYPAKLMGKKKGSKKSYEVIKEF